jgi:2-methylcitrate dehydratase PrpD
LGQFTDASVQDSQVQDVLQRVRLTHPDHASPDWDTPLPDIIEVVLHDGRRFQQRVDIPRGDPALPLTWEELVAKFQDCAAIVLPAEQVHDAVQHIARLEELPTLQPLMASLTLADTVA